MGMVTLSLTQIHTYPWALVILYYCLAAATVAEAFAAAAAAGVAVAATIAEAIATAVAAEASAVAKADATLLQPPGSGLTTLRKHWHS